MQFTKLGLMVCLGLILGGCGDRGLRSLTNPGEGPDEFAIVPRQPLQQPQDFSALPPPTPGGSNITDQDPIADGIAALGGRVQSVDAPIPSRDAAIVNQASRFGRDTNIRAQLAQEDEAFRKRRGRFTSIRFARVDAYVDVYRPLTLDANSEIERWRRTGVGLPTVPPSE